MLLKKKTHPPPPPKTPPPKNTHPPPPKKNDGPHPPSTTHPTQGQIDVRFSLPDRTLTLARPPRNRLPLAAFSFRPLFACLSLDNVLTTFSLLLTEARVALVSRRMALLTPVAEALLSLLFPFAWQVSQPVSQPVSQGRVCVVSQSGACVGCVWKGGRGKGGGGGIRVLCGFVESPHPNPKPPTFKPPSPQKTTTTTPSTHNTPHHTPKS